VQLEQVLINYYPIFMRVAHEKVWLVAIVRLEWNRGVGRLVTRLGQCHTSITLDSGFKNEDVIISEYSENAKIPTMIGYRTAYGFLT
jgi:hypothetical protein